MSTTLTEFLTSFTGIFVAMDVIGVVPIYLSRTKNFDRASRNRVVNSSMWVAFIVALIFVFVGRSVFKHIGISLGDFKIAGGLILLLVSLADLLGGQEVLQNPSGDQSGVVPLAVPLITGPGVLATLILSVSTVGYPITLAAMVLNYAISWVVLRKCDVVTRVLGKDGTVVLSKIAALLLAAIAVAMIRGGVFDVIAEWGGKP